MMYQQRKKEYIVKKLFPPPVTEMKDHNRRKVATIPGFQGIGQITPEAINQATKEGKPGPPKAYRPLLYLLNILSNLYETMIRQGLENEIE